MSRHGTIIRRAGPSLNAQPSVWDTPPWRRRDLHDRIATRHHGQRRALAPLYGPAKNFTYLAGFAYPGTLARYLDFPAPREVLLLWPRHEEVVLIVNHYAAPLA